MVAPADPIEWLSWQLAQQESILRGAIGEIRATPALSRSTDEAGALEAALALVVPATRHAALAVGARPLARSRPAIAQGVLSEM